MTQAVESPDFQMMEKSLSSFNIFEVLRCAGHEIRHSNILAWLLDPRESHGLGHHFLQRFFAGLSDGSGRKADHPFCEEINGDKLQSVTVRREWNNIDILLELRTTDCSMWVVCIENKFTATQGLGQLKRYRETVEKIYPAARRTFVFLTLREEKPHDVAYLVTSYEEVSRELQMLLTTHADAIAPQPKVLIDHYQSILADRLDRDSSTVRLAREIVLQHPKAIRLAQSIVEPPDLGKGKGKESAHSADLATRQIYDKHREAFDYVLKNRPNRCNEVSAVLKGRLLADGRNFGWEPAKCDPQITRFIPSEWRKLALIEGSELPRLFCAIHLAKDPPRLRFVASPQAPQIWKDKLSQRSRSWNLPGAVSDGRKESKKYGFYIEPLTDFRETASNDEAAGRIWQEVVSAMSRQDLKDMICDVAKLLS